MLKVILYHIMKHTFQQSLSYWHWVFSSQSQGFVDKLLISGWAAPDRPWLIVIRVWELWDGFFEFSEQCTSMWRLKNSRVEWALELSLREAGDCWKVWWRWWPLHWSWSGQEEVCQLCVRPVFALAANILPLTFLLLTVYGATAAKQDNARTQPPQYHDLCGRLSIPKMYRMLDIKILF